MISRRWHFYCKIVTLVCLVIAAMLPGRFVHAITAASLAQFRSLSAGAVSGTTISLSPTGGDPHPITGNVTPGEYWLDGDHLDTSNGQISPTFLDLAGTGNTYDLTGVTFRVDTRDLAGWGRSLGHGSTVHLVTLRGSGNLLQGLTLIGEDIALDIDPNAQRYADWGTQYGKLTGDNNTVDGATIVARGSRTDTYGLSDAFGKGASQGKQPYIGHRKAAGFVVDGTDTDTASNNTVNNLDLTMKTFGHGFFTGSNVANTVLSNSTITGELFPSQNVIDRPEYQEHGHTWWQYPIQDDIMLSGQEGGVRTYGGNNFTVDNVVVDGMRTGFATVATQGDVNITNSYAYNTTSGFDVGDNTTITGSGGNIVNGPLLVFYGSGNNTDIDLELTAGTPIGTNWSAAYFNGNADISITSDLAAGDLPTESYVRLGQRYFENWRDSDFNTATPDSNNPRAFNDQTFVNNTNQMLVLGENAEGNVGSSQAPVISNGKENHYDGVTLVQSGLRLEVEHEKGLGNSGEETGAAFSGNNVVYTGTATAQTFDDNGTIVEAGATLELLPSVWVNDERVTISGHGVDGQGAIYSEGASNQHTRLVGDTIVLDGDASIGIGEVGYILLTDSVTGTGNFTKRGVGALSIGVASSLDGNFIVEEGTLEGRSNVVHGDLTIHSGAAVAAFGGSMVNAPDNHAEVDGTWNLNSRSDDIALAHQIGGVSGTGLITLSNSSTDASGQLQILGDTGVSDYQGQIAGAVSVVKSGDSTQAFSGSLTHTGTTSITGGTLLINGTHTGGDIYSVAGGTLGGNGSIDASIIIESGGTLAPGASAGQLDVEDITLMAGSLLEIEIGGLLAGTEYDQLLGDSMTLAGDLAVSLLDLGSGIFMPDPTDTFIVVDGMDLMGMFDNVASGARIDTTGGEGSFLVTYDSFSDEVLLSAFLASTSPGDIDGDGDVDGADFLTWQRNGLSAGELSDWQNNYGNPSSIASATAVPEPAALSLLIAVCVGFLAKRN